MPPPHALDDAAFMDALLNVLIPAGPSGHPAAGTLGLAPAIAASARRDDLLRAAVEAGLNALRDAAFSEHPGGLPAMPPDAAAAFVKGQLAANPMLMMGLLRHTYPTYYQHPLVLEAIGEPPRPPFPEGFTVEPTDPVLLEKLESRRKTP